MVVVERKEELGLLHGFYRLAPDDISSELTMCLLSIASVPLSLALARYTPKIINTGYL